MHETQLSGRQPKPRVTFKIDVFDSLAEQLGHDTDDAKAKFLGVSPGTLSKIRNSKQRPGSDFIAAVRTAFPALPYERFFTEEQTT